MYSIYNKYISILDKYVQIKVKIGWNKVMCVIVSWPLNTTTSQEQNSKTVTIQGSYNAKYLKYSVLLQQPWNPEKMYIYI